MLWAPSERWRRSKTPALLPGEPVPRSVGNGRGLNSVHQAAMASEMDEPIASSASSHRIGEREAQLLLGALARVKARRFGRLIVTVNDGRVVDVEVIEKIDREVLKALAM